MVVIDSFDDDDEDTTEADVVRMLQLPAGAVGIGINNERLNRWIYDTCADMPEEGLTSVVGVLMVDDKGFDGDDEEQTAATPTEKSSNARPQSASTSARRRAQRELTKPQGQAAAVRAKPVGRAGGGHRGACVRLARPEAKKRNDAGRSGT